ncbi:tetratricopeptide repeat protein [Methylobacterium sp. B4]|uniref:tetratricopeptide repeat protein n=1 Tax=Methylobacterium sp. B4 TaxID=1938755 RepID=UPI000D756DB4|nr:tetratricopeptide repeat protein [Methylobacterium sp. B4]PXW67013.1 tetratricopeptide repeat protein [Methylobacterium sp. B4]
MDARRHRLLTALWLGLAFAGAADVAPALAAGKERTEKERKPHPPVSLDELYTRLKGAGDEAEAKAIATLIERRLGRSGSATADLLSDRARQAMSGNELPLAVELMDRAVALEPNWSEGWSRRATLFWRLSDTSSAIADLQRALVLEPRHFEAWAALGKLYLAQDDKGRALDAFRRAEALYPQWDVLQKAIERLTPEVDGRDL